MLRLPGLGMPMMSPGQASSASSRSRARNSTGLCTLMVLPLRECFSLAPRLKWPEHSRRKAMRSRWLGSMLATRSEEHTSELQSLMRISYAVFCLKKKKHYKYTDCIKTNHSNHHTQLHKFIHTQQHYNSRHT